MIADIVPVLRCQEQWGWQQYASARRRKACDPDCQIEMV